MTLLVAALRGNAAFSGISGIIALVGAPRVANALGTVPPWTIRMVGAGLVGFAILVARESRKPEPRAVRAILAADVAWVLGSVALVILGPGWLSSRGAALVTALAFVVGGFAVSQGFGLRALTRASSDSTRRSG